MPMIHDPDLADVLMSASADDMGLLIDVITDSGKGRISLSSSVCRQLMAAKDKGADESAGAIFAEELTRFGGNSLVNLFRGGSGVPYRELLADVAGHVGAKNKASASCAEMEMAIITKVFAQSLARMSEEDRKTLFESLGGLAYRPGMGPGRPVAEPAGDQEQCGMQTVFAQHRVGVDVVVEIAVVESDQHALFGQGRSGLVFSHGRARAQ